MILSHRGSDFDLAVMFANAIQEAIDVPFPGPLLGLSDQKEI